MDDRKEVQIEKKTYEKPQIEITVFKVEDICNSSGVFGEILGMDGTYN